MNKEIKMKNSIRTEIEQKEKLFRDTKDKIVEYLILNLEYHYCRRDIRNLNKFLCREYTTNIPVKSLKKYINYIKADK